LDLNVYLILTVLPFTMALSTLLFKKRSFALFAFLGGLVSIYCYLGITADGSLTTQYSSTVNVLASAALTSNTWLALIIVPGFLAVADFLIGVGRAFKMV
jgi:hypothetical protein